MYLLQSSDVEVQRSAAAALGNFSTNGGICLFALRNTIHWGD